MLYPKDTEKWKQLTTSSPNGKSVFALCCIPKILKNESNSQLSLRTSLRNIGCVVSQRYWKMKAIHNGFVWVLLFWMVVLYPKDTEKWKQFTTNFPTKNAISMLCCIPKILKNESNSQLLYITFISSISCVVSQRYWKMKAIHNKNIHCKNWWYVVLYPKDTEKWKQFTTESAVEKYTSVLCCIPKILKNESNSQQLVAKHL